MKPSNVWHGHSTRPSLPAGTARKGNGHLSGRRPLHLLLQDRSVAQKPHWGFCCCANASLPWQAEQAHRTTSKEKQSVPDGERPVVHIAIVSWLLAGCVLFGGAPCFFTMLHHFPRAASGILHQHGSGSDAAHPGIVPIFCAGMPCKLARKQCHFPAYCPILSA